MKIVKSWWFKAICIVLVGAIIGTTFSVLNLQVKVRSDNGVVSLGLSGGAIPARADSMTRVPTSDGDVTGTWTPTPASPNNRWSKVDETSPDDTNYITGTAVGRSLFNFSNFNIPNDAYWITLKVYYRAKDATSGVNNIRPSLKVGGQYFETNDAGVDANGSAFQTYTAEYQTNPLSTSPWRASDINGTAGTEYPLQQFGVMSNDVTPNVQVSMVYAEVFYTTPGIGIQSVAGDQVIVGGYTDTIGGAADEYNLVMGGYLWTATENQRLEVIPTAGSLKSLYVRLSGAPDNGAGTQGYTFTLRVNSANSTLTLNITETGTSANNTANSVAVVAGDTVDLLCTKIGTPLTTMSAAWSFIFTPTTTDQTIIMAGGSQQLPTAYLGYTAGYNALTDETSFPVRSIPFPTAGTLSKFYMVLSTDPGTSPSSYNATLQKNYAAAALTVQIQADNTTGSDTTHSVSITSGDLIHIRVNPVNAPSASPYIGYGMMFVPTTSGESLILGATTTNPSTTLVRYNHADTSSLAWTGTETSAYSLIQATTLKNFYVKSDIYVGIDKSYQFDIRAGGASSGVTANVSGSQYRVPTADDANTGTYINNIGGATPLWSYVNETTANVSDTTYIIGQNNAGGYATFNFTAFSVPANATIESMTVYVRHADNVSGTNKITAELKVNGTYYQNATLTEPGATFTTTAYKYTTNPNTSAKWLAADINGTGANPLQAFGCGSNDFNPDVNVSMIYAVVNYVPADVTNTYATTDGQTLDIMCTPQGTPDAIQPAWGIVGYIAPGSASISNTPSGIDFGSISENSTYYAKTGATPPSFPLGTGNCTFTMTNDGGVSVNIVVHTHNFTGGTGWQIVGGTPSTSQVRMSLYRSGDNSGDNTTLSLTDVTFKSGLGAGSSVYWDIKLETGIYQDGEPKTTTITFTASAA